MELNSFMVMKRDENWNHLVDERGVLKHYSKKFALEEVQKLISRAFKMERSRYGWELYVADRNENISIYFRFDNVTTKVRDNIEGFIKSNWD